MKKVYFVFAFFLICGIGFSQEELSKEEKERREKNIEAGNPFAKFGYKAKIATLSKGKYLEFHDLDSIVTIGSVRFNVYKNEIVGSIVQDTLNTDSQPIGDITGRWMSPDPLSEEFPEWSPYTMVMNSPLRFNDPTGMAPEWTPDKNGNLIAEKGDNATSLAKYLGRNVNEVGQTFKVNGKSIGANYEFKEGQKAVLNNNMKSDVEQYNSTGQIENESCHEAAYSAVKGLEINETSAEVHNSLDSIVEGLSSSTATDFAKGYTQTNSTDSATFGKTIAVFGDGEHSAVYYGTSNDGTTYYYSKNGNNGPPTIMKENDLVQQYGTAKYYNPNVEK